MNTKYMAAIAAIGLFAIGFIGPAQSAGTAAPEDTGIAAYAGHGNVIADTAGPGSLDLNGLDYGIRVTYATPYNLFVKVEADRLDVDNRSLDYRLDELRAGGGVAFQLNEQYRVYGEMDYVATKERVSVKSAPGTSTFRQGGVFIGAGGTATFGATSVYTRVGYVMVDGKSSDFPEGVETDGVDGLIGVGFKVTNRVSAFTEARLNNPRSEDLGFRQPSISVRAGLKVGL